MSQVEDLLNTVAEVPVHTHPVPDTDTYFIIDPITRKIENTTRKKNVIMQYDHNSERFTFELPRYIDGHDMLECTSVTVNVDNIEAVETDGIEVTEARVNSDAPDMTDLRVHPDDPEKVISSWLISRNSTQFAGILSFHIEYKCADSNGNVVYEWGTDTYDEIQVKARKKNGDAVVIEHADLLEQWRTQIFGAGDSVMADISAEGKAQVAAVKAESEAQQEAVELKGVQTLDTIPEDYTETNNMADEAVRFKGDAIVCESAGESIVLTDSSDDYIRGLKLFGKSTQVTTTGKNLLDIDENLSFTGLREKTVNIPAGTYVLTWAGRTSTGQNKPVIRFVNNSVLIDLLADVGNSKVTFAKDETTIYVYSNGYDYAASENVSATITQLMLSVDGGDYEPYTGGKPSPSPEYPQDIASIDNVVTSVYGDNLLATPEVGKTWTANGLTCTYEGDGIFHFTGTYNHMTTDAGFGTVYMDVPVDRNAKYTLSAKLISGTPPDTFNPYIGLSSDTKNHQNFLAVNIEPTTEVGSTVSWTRLPSSYLSDAKKISRFWIYLHNGTQTAYTVDFRFQVWLNKSDSAMEYTPYHGQSAEIDRTLPGIPVASGGNYTDSDGQQWICDEIDLARGVYVQRLYEAIYDGSEDERWKKSGESYFYLIKESMPYKSKANGNAISTHFRFAKGSLAEPGRFMIGNAYGPMIRIQSDVVDESGLRTWIANNPFTILYELETPIETPLTADEITAFKALRTNYPNTTILNDAGAWMSVKYNADTKTYVENPKVLKLVDSSTGVVYELKIVDGNLTVVPV